MVDSPYVGLVPYLEEHAPYFFGRDQEVRIVSQNLRATRLTVLYGESGVGKSSLLRAGVASQLRGMARDEIRRFGNARFIPVVCQSWRTDPVHHILEQADAALLQSAGGQTPRYAAGSAPLDVQFEECARRYEFDGQILLILDQFEEFFQYAQQLGQQAAATAFARQLPPLLGREDLRVRVLLSIREDSLASLDPLKGSVPHLFNNLLRVRHLTAEQAEEAIVKPLARFKEEHAAFDAPTDLDPNDGALARWVVQDIVRAQEQTASGSHEQVQASYLQLVMTRWWEAEKQQRSRFLRRTTLEQRLGGVKRVAESHFGETVNALPLAQRRLAARMFGAMVTAAGRKMALSVSELPGADDRRKDVEQVVDQLYKRRILAAVPPPPGGRPDDPCYEFAHDNLARAALDWRKDFERAQELAIAQAHRRRTWLGILLALIAVGSVSVTFLALRARNAERQAHAAESNLVQERRLSTESKIRAIEAKIAEEEASRLQSLGRTEEAKQASARQQTLAVSAPETQPFYMLRPVTAEDLRGKSKWELDLMRNEIYARYGRMFRRPELQQYFAAKSWYAPRYAPDSFPNSLLTPVQLANVEAILRYQRDASR